MTLVYRLKLLTALLAVGAAVTGAFVIADAVKQREKASLENAARTATGLSDELVAGKFSRMPVLTYETPDKEQLFAFQLQPKLDPGAARPRDLIVLVDTSASQSGNALILAKQITQDIAANLNVNDRMAIWTVNIPKATHSLTSGLVGPRDPLLEGGLDKLKQEYASGAVDLKNAIEKSMKDFDGKVSRQQILIYLGDGESSYEPLAERDRYQLAEQMVANKVAFYSVPLGLKIHSSNIHALAIGTGGSVVRMNAQQMNHPTAPQTDLVASLNKAFAAPVILPSEVKWSNGIVSSYPTRMPPIRSDSPTLVLGRFGKDRPQKIEATITGKIAGKEVTVTVSEDVPAPAVDNYFLLSMLNQWQNSNFKEAPALLRADRTLALAYERNRLGLEELLTQAQVAITAGQYDAATKLYESAQNLNPQDVEAQAGIKVVEKIRKGQLTKEQFKAVSGNRTGIVAQGEQIARNLQDPKTEPQPDKKPDATAPATPDTGDLLKQEQARRAILEQQTKQVVEEALDRARKTLQDGDPDGAKRLAVAQRDSVRSNTEISDTLRNSLTQKIDGLLRYIGVEGERITRQQSEERERVARARQRLLSGEETIAREERIKERVRAFTQLMQQARYEEAQREAEVMRQEFINKGDPVPLETLATYQIGQASTNLREARELVRLREDRFLLTMIQVEKSHVPYPDEPAVHYPPSKVWKELVARRQGVDRLDITGEGGRRIGDNPKRLQYLQDVLNSPLPAEAKGIDGTLRDVLDYLEELVTPAQAARDASLKVKILIKDKGFKEAKDENYRVAETNVNLPKLGGVSFGTALRFVVSQVDGTFALSDDFIEVVHQKQYARVSGGYRVTSALGVADLVVPFPNAINSQVLQQNLQALGGTFSLGGGFLGQPIAGAFGGGPFQVGGQFGGGGVGGQGGGQPNQNNVGMLFQGGIQGGITGFGGGVQGQFGQLGGQFGFQGGTSEDLLMITILHVIGGPSKWKPLFISTNNLPTGAADPANADPTGAADVPEDEKWLITYYPTTYSLLINAPSSFERSRRSKARNTYNSSFGGQVNANINGNGNANVQANVNGPAIAGMNRPNGGRPFGDGVVSKAIDPKAQPKKDIDPKKVWNDAIAKGVADPGKIIACVDFLAQFNEFRHAAELVKASLRKGVTAEAWAHEALAIALEMSQGNQVELERARVSSIDLAPDNAQAYLRVSKALSQLGEPERAIRFCKQAAKLQPEMPDAYVNALAFAGELKNLDSDVSAWAADGLLSRNWPEDNVEYHATAKKAVEDAIAKLTKENRMEEAKRLKQILVDDKQRDLVIQLKWVGAADLDLKVEEANGSVCSVDQKQTTGGGVWYGDILSQKEDDRSETYTATHAFRGTYKIMVDKVWGKPDANKAHIHVIRHQGTPNERKEVITLELDKANSVTINLENGSRTTLAKVPPAVVASGSSRKVDRQEQLMKKMRAMTTPVYVQKTQAGLGTASKTATPTALATEALPIAEEFTFQTTVPPPVSGAMEYHGEVVMNNKTGQTEMRMKPVFQSINKTIQVKVPMIPGSEE